MLNKVAWFISFLSNPIILLLPIPYLLVVRETGNPLSALFWTVFSLFFVFIVGLFVLISVRKGYFTDLDVSKREQRPLLFLFVLLVSLVYFLILVFLQGPVVLLIVLTGVFFSVLVFSFFLDIKVKASIHVATVSALIFSLSILFSSGFLLLLGVIPIIAWSRVRIKRHSVQEALVGGITGVTVTLLFYVFFKLILGISVSGLV